MADPGISLVIADKLAEVHQLVVPMCKRPTWLYELSEKYINTITKIQQDCPPQDPAAQEIMKYLSQYNLKEELEWLR